MNDRDFFIGAVGITLSFLGGLLSLSAGVGVGNTTNKETENISVSQRSVLKTHSNMLDLSTIPNIRDLLTAAQKQGATHVVVEATYGHYISLNMQFERESTRNATRIRFSGGGKIDLIIFSASASASVMFQFAKEYSGVTVNVNVDTSAPQVGAFVRNTSSLRPRDWSNASKGDEAVLTEDDRLK